MVVRSSTTSQVSPNRLPQELLNALERGRFLSSNWQYPPSSNFVTQLHTFNLTSRSNPHPDIGTTVRSPPAHAQASLRLERASQHHGASPRSAGEFDLSDVLVVPTSGM